MVASTINHDGFFCQQPGSKLSHGMVHQGHKMASTTARTWPCKCLTKRCTWDAGGWARVQAIMASHVFYEHVLNVYFGCSSHCYFTPIASKSHPWLPISCQVMSYTCKYHEPRGQLPIPFVEYKTVTRTVTRTLSCVYMYVCWDISSLDICHLKIIPMVPIHVSTKLVAIHICY